MLPGTGEVSGLARPTARGAASLQAIPNAPLSVLADSLGRNGSVHAWGTSLLGEAGGVVLFSCSEAVIKIWVADGAPWPVDQGLTRPAELGSILSRRMRLPLACRGPNPLCDTPRSRSSTRPTRPAVSTATATSLRCLAGGPTFCLARW